MKRDLHILGTAVLLALICGSAMPSTARAAGVVGTGTAASCTDSALDTALTGGGLVTFDCGPDPVTIDISTGTGTKTIVADTTIDGGGLITISGGNRARVFSVGSDVKFSVESLAIANGVCGPIDIGSTGGGIYSRGTVAIANSTLTGNGGPAYFGGCFGGAIATNGRLTVTNSTFSGNSAGVGGAIYNNYGSGTVTVVTVTNSTFLGNSADSGGAIYDTGDISATLTFAVANCTFSGNSASVGGGILQAGGGVLLRNTIVANSPSGGDCYPGYNPIADGGHNLDDDGSCGFLGASLSHTNPMLDPAGLADNGGPTQTIALLPGSPAIDAGDPAVCANPPVNGLDQRGFVRPGAGSENCSIGAFESDDPPPPVCTGDCDRNRVVAIDELSVGVNIVLDLQPVDACPAFANADGLVDIAQLVRGVTNALDGCGTG